MTERKGTATQIANEVIALKGRRFNFLYDTPEKSVGK